MLTLVMVFPVFLRGELQTVVCVFLLRLFALSYFGHYCRFVLATHKEDGSPMLYRDIAVMKREITLYYCAKKDIAGTTYDVVHSTSSSIDLILSELAVVSEEVICTLNHKDRHHVWESLGQYAVGMSFGHFLNRNYKW